jgi:hypothetical protein
VTQVSKKDTSRVPIEAARPSSSEPKTIRIRPTVVPGAGRIGSGSVALGEADRPAAAKRTTSRISLESVMGRDGAAGRTAQDDDNAPRTIRLKRPGDVAAVRPAGEEGEAGAAPTVRRTIRVKRADASVRPVAIAPVELAPAVPVDEVHWAWPTFAILAALVTCVLIYVLMAQCFGHDVSLTPLSYGWSECDLPWPGKIPLGLR